jgi:serine/threonine-protein kinase
MTSLRERLQGALGDAYRIEKELTGGGMSRLFLAEEASLHRQVVIKLLPPEFTSDVSTARFEQEIQLAAHLQHPNILPVLAAGARDDLLYYIMPYVTGESLRHRLTQEGKLPIADAVRIVHEVADALAYAHAEGVIHRDIKPENILLEENHAVLTDFGVARALAEARSGGRLTDTGMSVGTAGYMSPEQAAGERHIDARADLYALAVVGYEMVAGQPPFEGPTAQAVLAAHLSKAPRPLIEVRAETPPEIAAAIARALAKAPQDRFHSAAEFRDALQVPAAAARRARRVPFSVAVGVAVLLVAGAALLVRSPARIALDANLVVVAPFDVLDPKLALWREGLVDVLSRNLDGAGPLRTVSPTLVVRRWSGRADPAAAAELGKTTGARLAVFGQLVGTRADSVRLTATLLDVATGRALAELELRDVSTNMDRLTDSLTVGLLRELGRTRAIGAVRLAAFGSTSLPALKAFLQGEQFFRRTQWDSAIAYYGRAIAIDSTFALALHAMGTSLGWQRVGGDSLSSVYSLRAGTFNRGLSPRDSLLIVADSLSAVMYQYIGDTAFAQHSRRLSTTLNEAARRYPDDPMVWYSLGDAGYHFFAYVGGTTDQQVLDAFDRSIALDSAFAPSYIHPVDLALGLDDSAAARHYAALYLALTPTDVEGMGIPLIAKLLDPTAASSAEVRRLLDTASAAALGLARTTFIHWPDSAETGLRVARIAAHGGHRGSGFWTDSMANQLRLAAQLTLRGHLREAYATAGTRMRPVFGDLAVLGAVPAEIATAEFASWKPGTGSFPGNAVWWWVARGDTSALRDLARRSDSLARSRTPVRGGGYWRYMGEWARASHALARHDTLDALRRFEALPDSLCPLCVQARLPRAQLLAARGREREALALLEVHFPPFFAVEAVLFKLEGARIHERLGQREQAIAKYRFVAAVWRNADPELQPYVDEATAALQRLSAERQ